MRTRMKPYFKVYRNGVFAGTTSGASLKEAKRSVLTGYLDGGDCTGRIKIGTHMGYWKRKISGYQYFTTVGVTVDFVRFAREVQS